MTSSGVILRPAPRSGIAVAWVLVILTVLSVTSATAAWQFSTGRRMLERRQNRVQALWLARSGGELAAARWFSDAGCRPIEALAYADLLYSGEIDRQLRKTRPVYRRRREIRRRAVRDEPSRRSPPRLRRGLSRAARDRIERDRYARRSHKDCRWMVQRSAVRVPTRTAPPRNGGASARESGSRGHMP